MTGIELYSKTAANNNSATPNGWPEGMAPSAVNDCARQMQAAIRTWYEDAQWINWGDTTVYVATTQFKISGSDVTSRYSVGRRVRAVGSSTGTIYGTITVSAFSTDTTVTVAWDSGTLSNETLTISIGIITFSNSASPIQAPFIDSTAIMKGSADSTKKLKIEVDGLTTATTRTWTAPDADLTVVGVDTVQSLTNKTFQDSTTRFADDGDATKLVAIQCSGITSGNTRTVAIPDKSGTLAMTSDIVASPFTASYQSAAQTMTAGSGATLAHSLGGRPKIIYAYIRCKTAELNYAIGDEVPMPIEVNNFGINAWSDGTTNIRYWIATGLRLPNATTGGDNAITYANWELFIRAYA